MRGDGSIPRSPGSQSNGVFDSQVSLEAILLLTSIVGRWPKTKYVGCYNTDVNTFRGKKI